MLSGHEATSHLRHVPRTFPSQRRIPRTQLQRRRSNPARAERSPRALVGIQVRADGDDARVGALQADEPFEVLLAGSKWLCWRDGGTVDE